MSNKGKQRVAYKEILNNNRDSGYKAFQEKLIPGVENFTGVRLPVIKKLAREIAKADYADFLKDKNFTTYEEKMLYGLVIGCLKVPFQEMEGYITDFVPSIDNWAICDSFCAGLKSTISNKEETLKIIEKYTSSINEYELRFAVVMFMNYFMEPEYMEKMFKFFNQVRHDGYYVKMGIAWAISTAFIKEREKTLEFMRVNQLDSWTHNKAIQKIGESLRVSKEDKAMVGLLKKR